MTANVAQFTAAIDKAYKTYSTQEVQIDKKDYLGLDERSARNLINDRYQQQLLRARAAFLQEFRNHSVVVDREVKKIKEDLTEKLEAKYGERLSQLKQQCAEASAQCQKHVDEISQLKQLASAQEAYLAAVRSRWGLENKEKMTSQIAALKEQLEAKEKERVDLSHQLLSRNDLVAQLGGELSSLEDELKRNFNTSAEEKRVLEEKIKHQSAEMKQQQESFSNTLREYERRFNEYAAKTTAELQIQDLLNNRRSEAITQMTEERQRLIKARTKPTPRIGADDVDHALEAKCQPYDLANDTLYRVDPMGLDTSWRDYQGSDSTTSQSPRGGRRKRPVPKFRVERIRGDIAAANCAAKQVEDALSPKVE
jgi:hypothetical protein